MKYHTTLRNILQRRKKKSKGRQKQATAVIILRPIVFQLCLVSGHLICSFLGSSVVAERDSKSIFERRRSPWIKSAEIQRAKILFTFKTKNSIKQGTKWKKYGRKIDNNIISFTFRRRNLFKSKMFKISQTCFAARPRVQIINSAKALSFSYRQPRRSVSEINYKKQLRFELFDKLNIWTPLQLILLVTLLT